MTHDNLENNNTNNDVNKIIDKSPKTIQTMFNNIANKYDFMNNVMSFGTQKYVKQNSVKLLNIKPHDRVIDLCTGTGDLAKYIKIFQPQACVTGIDFSDRMIEIAKRKIDNIQFLQGDVTYLPYEDNYFDFVTMGFGLRNIFNAEKAIEEVYRILKPGGIFMHLDFGKKNIFSKIYDLTTLFYALILTDNLSAYSYLIQSKKFFPEPQELIKDFESKGFKCFAVKNYLFGTISVQYMKK